MLSIEVCPYLANWAVSEYSGDYEDSFNRQEGPMMRGSIYSTELRTIS